MRDLVGASLRLVTGLLGRADTRGGMGDTVPVELCPASDDDRLLTRRQGHLRRLKRLVRLVLGGTPYEDKTAQDSYSKVYPGQTEEWY
eukprot:866181-Rhodomonas_salina.1